MSRPPEALRAERRYASDGCPSSGNDPSSSEAFRGLSRTLRAGRGRYRRVGGGPEAIVATARSALAAYDGPAGNHYRRRSAAGPAGRGGISVAPVGLPALACHLNRKRRARKRGPPYRRAQREERMSAKLGRRTFTQTRRRHRNGGGAADAGDRAEQADPHRPAHRQDRAARAGRHPDGAGHQPVPQGPQQHARRPQGRSCWSATPAAIPAGTKTKAQELIERDNVDLIFGPLAAFELLAITDYVAAAQDARSSASPRPRTCRSASPTRISCAPPAPRRRTCTRWPTTRRRN